MPICEKQRAFSFIFSLTGVDWKAGQYQLSSYEKGAIYVPDSTYKIP
jgi:hypothetical protein